MKKTTFFHMICWFLIVFISIYEYGQIASKLEFHQTKNVSSKKECQIDHALYLNKVIYLNRSYEDTLIRIFKSLLVFSVCYLMIAFISTIKVFLKHFKEDPLLDRSYMFFKRFTLKSRAHPPTY